MKLHLRLLPIVLLCCSAAFAQQPKAAFSAPFDEPDALDSKVIQCQNGNTFLFSFTKSDGIAVQVFDRDRKQIAAQTLEGSEATWQPKNMVGTMFSGVSKGSKVCAIYPVGNEVVMFFEQVAESEPSLYRIRLNSADGKLVKEDKIAEIAPYDKGSGYAMVFGQVKPKDFFVERDPATGAYAVAVFDGFAHETGKRLEVIHFNAAHGEIGRGFYDAPGGQYKYINYLGMVVRGEEYVDIAAYCHNGAGGESKVFISSLRGSAITHHPIEGTAGLKDTRGLMQYNPVTKALELFTISAHKTIRGMDEDIYVLKETFMSIDPATFSVAYATTPNSQLISKNRKLKYANNGEETYTGIPMNFIINPDGTTTIVYEDQRPVINARGDGPGVFAKPGVMIGNSVQRYNNPFLSDVAAPVSYNRQSDIGITDCDLQGKETMGYVVRKSQKSSAVVPPLSHADTRNGRVVFSTPTSFGAMTNTGFYSFDYLSTPAGRFVFFNDHPDNFERDAEKNPKTLQAVSDANTICYRLTGGELSKFYFFGQPDDSFDNRFALINSGDYNEASGDYAVLMIEKSGRKKQARMAWVSLK